MSKELAEIKTTLEDILDIKFNSDIEIARTYYLIIMLLEKCNNEIKTTNNDDELKIINIMIGILNYYKTCFDTIIDRHLIQNKEED